jgi:hypothetical protein
MPRYGLAIVPSDEEEDEYQQEEEPPHPVGFDSPWGRTWFSLDPPIISPGQCKYSLDFDSDDEEDDYYYAIDGRQVQAYPPLSNYIDSKTAPTSILLRYPNVETKENDEDDSQQDMYMLSQLLTAACVIDIPMPAQLASPPPWSQTRQRIQQKVQQEKERMQNEHMEAAQGLKMLLIETERQAAMILQERQEQELELQQEEEALRRQREAVEKQQQHEDERKGRLATEEQALREKREQEKKAAKMVDDAKAAKKTEFVTKAKTLVAQLVQVRASIEPFDKSKAVSKRRLQMKKIVNGKVNTLSEDANKVKAVAAEVSQAIAVARSEDEQIKQMIQAGSRQDLTPEMARGKRYLVDLLASNAITRVQAEGFNGQRGDGFPLAGMLAMVSMDDKELVPILAAHIYTVCPTAIPALPKPSPDASEDELMSSLGMLKDKNGEYETFPRFLTRTEVRPLMDVYFQFGRFL